MFTGTLDQDVLFIDLKKYYNNEISLSDFYSLNEVYYTKENNVHSMEDAKKLWANQVVAQICTEKFYIKRIKKLGDTNIQLPLWLMNRYNFVVNDFDKCFMKIIEEDEDCKDLTKTLFMPTMADVPYKL